ncbi:MAG TPA: hypothetical protein VNW29_03800 [Candidatus Sulfotelmatobacter sp.]|jgi:hypothetical protein|nr:hypothetical protein [Candidatus Sulfotelmatobacter sp.]
MTFTVFLKHVATGDKYELPFEWVNYVEELNNGSSATFNLDFATINEQVAIPYGTNPKDLFTAVLSEIWVENDSGIKVWFGLVTEYTRTKDASGNNKLQIAAIDYFGIFQKRRTGASVDFTAVDPATIPWSLINTSQLLTHGDLGITVGVTASTGLSVTQNYKRADIKQSISDLSNFKLKNSFDFDIDYTKKLNIYYPTKGSLRANVVFDDSNILGDAVKIPVLLNMTNSVFARGQGINNDVPEVNRQSLDAIIAEYTLLEDVLSDTTTSDTTVLSNEGDRKLALEQLPLYAITIKHDIDTDITTYGLGDFVIVNVPEEQISYAQYRVKKRTVDIDDSGTLIVQLDLLTI